MRLTVFSFAFILFSCVSLCAAENKPLRVPQAKPAMIDGKLASGEWTDAAQFPLGDFARVYTKQSDRYVYLAVEFLKDKNGTVDLYLTDGQGIYDLHASAKLGERVLTDGKWPEEWKWWNNQRWVANVARVDSWQQRSLLPENVREYQIERSRFPGANWRVMFEIMTEGKPDWKTTRFPETARTSDPTDWFELRLR